MTGVRLAPVDTLFFRDGTPFSAGAAPQDGVESLFPPHPVSVAGAVRAALARCNGWNGQGRWPEELDAVLGSGPDDLGALSLDGPFLLRCDQPLFRAPRHLLGANQSGAWTPRALLRPGRETDCDLRERVRLPEAPQADGPTARLRTGDDWWLTAVGLETVLRGGLPSGADAVSSRTLWAAEPRIGLERDDATRTAQEGMLYSTHHVRLERDIALGVRVVGVPAGWRWPFGLMVPLGGESRLAECRRWDGGARFPSHEAVSGSGRMAVIALTPLDLDADVCRGRRPLDGPGEARVVSACLRRPQRIGGWDSLARRPLPLRSVLAPGSVLFCEAADPVRFLEAIADTEGQPRIGARQPWGFGRVAFGVWPGDTEVRS